MSGCKRLCRRVRFLLPVAGYPVVAQGGRVFGLAAALANAERVPIQAPVLRLLPFAFFRVLSLDGAVTARVPGPVEK